MIDLVIFVVVLAVEALLKVCCGKIQSLDPVYVILSSDLE